MNKQISLLIDLQKAELEANKLNAKCQTLPEMIKKLDDEFQCLQGAVDEQRKKYGDIQKAHREKEERMKRGQEALKRAKERLGEVKTNKEYQAVLKEIEIIEEKNSNIEDEIIAFLEVMDQARDDLKVKEEELEGYKKHYESERRKLEEEFHSLDELISACKARNLELKSCIEGDFLKKYEAIKTINSGMAVAAVWKEICEGCYTSIPPQLYIELQKSEELKVCPNCNRLIYWYNRNGQAEKKAPE